MQTRLVSISALALVLSSPLVVMSGTKAICTASCGAEAPVTCSVEGSCSAFDRNCSTGEQGHVTCGSSTIYCASTCPVDPVDCRYDSVCSYDCPNDQDCGYNPCDRGPHPGTGCYYNWSPQTLCCVAVDPGAGCLDICF